MRIIQPCALRLEDLDPVEDGGRRCAQCHTVLRPESEAVECGWLLADDSPEWEAAVQWRRWSRMARAGRFLDLAHEPRTEPVLWEAASSVGGAGQRLEAAWVDLRYPDSFYLAGLLGVSVHDLREDATRILDEGGPIDEVLERLLAELVRRPVWETLHIVRERLWDRTRDRAPVPFDLVARILEEPVVTQMRSGQAIPAIPADAEPVMGVVAMPPPDLDDGFKTIEAEEEGLFRRLWRRIAG